MEVYLPERNGTETEEDCGGSGGHTDIGVKMEKNPGVIKGRFYVTTSLSDSWEAFTPLHAGVTL